MKSLWDRVWDVIFSYPYALMVLAVAILVGATANGRILYYVFSSVCLVLAAMAALGAWKKSR